MRHVTAVFKDHPLRALDPVLVGPHAGRCRLVVTTGQHQRRHVDLVQFGCDVPILERADHKELIRPVHCMINRRIAAKLVKARLHFGRVRDNAANMPVIDPGCRFLVGRVVVGFGLFMRVQRVLYVLRHFAALAHRFRRPQRHRGRRIRNRQRFQPLGPPCAIFGRQHPAPGLAQNVKAVALAQMVDQVFQLVHEQLHRPESAALVGQMGGIAAAQLVVMDDRAAIIGQQLVGVDVIMGSARPAVQQKHRRPVRGKIARHPIPSLIGPELCPAFNRLHPNLPAFFQS